MNKTYHLFEVTEKEGILLGNFIKDLGHLNHAQAGKELKESYPLSVDSNIILESPVLQEKPILGLTEEGWFLPSGETCDWIGKSRKGYVFILIPRDNDTKILALAEDGSTFPILVKEG